MDYHPPDQDFPRKHRSSSDWFTISSARTEGCTASTSGGRASCHFPSSQAYHKRRRQSLECASASPSACLSHFSYLGMLSECHNSSAGHSSSQTLTQFSSAPPTTLSLCLPHCSLKTSSTRDTGGAASDRLLAITNSNASREKCWNHGVAVGRRAKKTKLKRGQTKNRGGRERGIKKLTRTVRADSKYLEN